ncbi:trans-2-enoyl-CoA reductase [Arthrobacter bambusae]|nr:trans-2-enoyl-CoA reductase [Arthrobacter bambusae]MDQ0096616.1 trans-2-enoyl-CoA reductase [Arthrobacter bambusae]
MLSTLGVALIVGKGSLGYGLSPRGPVTYGAPADGSPVHTGANPGHG